MAEEYDSEHLDQPPVKPFLLFMGATYYPGEGVEDLKCSADTVDELIEEARGKLDRYSMDWFQIVQHSNMAVLIEGFAPAQPQDDPIIREDRRR